MFAEHSDLLDRPDNFALKAGFRLIHRNLQAIADVTREGLDVVASPTFAPRSCRDSVDLHGFGLRVGRFAPTSPRGTIPSRLRTRHRLSDHHRRSGSSSGSSFDVVSSLDMS